MQIPMVLHIEAIFYVSDKSSLRVSERGSADLNDIGPIPARVECGYRLSTGDTWGTGKHYDGGCVSEDKMNVSAS